MLARQAVSAARHPDCRDVTFAAIPESRIDVPSMQILEALEKIKAGERFDVVAAARTRRGRAAIWAGRRGRRSWCDAPLHVVLTLTLLLGLAPA